MVNEEAQALGLQPKDLAVRKGGKKFKKAQDAAMIALREKRDAKLKKAAQARQ